MQVAGVEESHFPGLDGAAQFGADLADTPAAGHPYLVVPVPLEKRNEKQHEIAVAHPHGDTAELSAASADDILVEMQLLFALADAENQKHSLLRTRMNLRIIFIGKENKNGTGKLIKQLRNPHRRRPADHRDRRRCDHVYQHMLFDEQRGADDQQRVCGKDHFENQRKARTGTDGKDIQKCHGTMEARGAVEISETAAVNEFEDKSREPFLRRFRMDKRGRVCQKDHAAQDQIQDPCDDISDKNGVGEIKQQQGSQSQHGDPRDVYVNKTGQQRDFLVDLPTDGVRIFFKEFTAEIREKMKGAGRRRNG